MESYKKYYISHHIMAITTIQLHIETRERLHKLGSGITYDRFVNILCDLYEHKQEPRAVEPPKEEKQDSYEELIIKLDSLLET